MMPGSGEIPGSDQSRATNLRTAFIRDILGAGLKVGVATVAGLLGWVVAGKVLAVALGAAGVGLFGLLRQLLQNLTVLASFNGQAALVQGIASRGTTEEQKRFAGSVLRIQVLFAGGTAILLVLTAPWIGPWLIPHPDAPVLLRWLAAAMVVMVAQAYMLGLLNGHRLVDQMVKAQLWTPLVVLIVVYPLIRLVREGHPAGFVLMLGAPAVAVTAAAAWSLARAGWLPGLCGSRIDRRDTSSFVRMSSVLVVTGVITTGTQFFQSWVIAKRLGLAQAGEFWTAWTLSMAYVTIVLGSLGVYYMPMLSGIADVHARQALIRRYLRLALVGMPTLISFVIVFKPWVVQGMFSTALTPALKVMRWMLIGDLFKGVSWVLAFPMLAFADLRWFLWTELGFYVAIAATTWAWLSIGGGIEGLGALFMLLYTVYLVVTAYYVWLKHGVALTVGEVTRFIGGLVLVVSLSLFTWRDEVVRLGAVGVLAIAGGGFIGVFFRRADWTAFPIGRTKAAN